MQNSLITIITSTFNVAKELPITLDSIKSQTHTNIQWILSDGASTDGTLDIIKENEKGVIDFWVSERDNGIYDAWNTVLPQIKGDWVLFLGAGDKFCSNVVLERISTTLVKNKNKLLIYGKTTVVSEDYKHIINVWGKPWSDLKSKWETIRPALPPHPSSFFNSEIFLKDKYVFPDNYKIAGDSHLFLTLIKKEFPMFIDENIDIMPSGGISSSAKTKLKALREMKKLNKEFNIKTPIKNYILGVSKIYGYVLLSRILTEKKLLVILSRLKKSRFE